MMRIARTKARTSSEVGYLVFSDVHLGSDVNELTPRVRHRPENLDDDLVALLDHYRVTPSESTSRRWHLIIAGDFIDFVGMLVSDTGETEDDLSGDAGLGSASSMALRKLSRAADRHPTVFDALGRFVESDHSLTFVIGNHDLELHWPDVQQALRQSVLKRVAPALRESLGIRVQIEPIFFWAEGTLFVEHGHRYDPTCVGVATFAPHNPVARHRMLPTLSDVLLRLIVRRVDTIDEHGHENEGLDYYRRLVVRTGLRGVGNLARAFFHAISVAIGTWWQLMRGGLRSLRRLHLRRLRRFAAFRSIGWHKLRAFDALAVKPSIASLHAIFSTLLLDRLALFSVTPIFVLATFFIPASMLARFSGALAFVLLARILHEKLVTLRSLDAAERMERRAKDVARLFPATFVVMGHTHMPVERALTADVVYINTGTWAEEADERGLVTPPAPRTHFVVEGIDTSRGELRRWVPGNGPERWTKGG